MDKDEAYYKEKIELATKLWERNSQEVKYGLFTACLLPPAVMGIYLPYYTQSTLRMIVPEVNTLPKKVSFSDIREIKAQKNFTRGFTRSYAGYCLYQISWFLMSIPIASPFIYIDERVYMGALMSL